MLYIFSLLDTKAIPNATSELLQLILPAFLRGLSTKVFRKQRRRNTTSIVLLCIVSPPVKLLCAMQFYVILGQDWLPFCVHFKGVKLLIFSHIGPYEKLCKRLNKKELLYSATYASWLISLTQHRPLKLTCSILMDANHYDF